MYHLKNTFSTSSPPAISHQDLKHSSTPAPSLQHLPAPFRQNLTAPFYQHLPHLINFCDLPLPLKHVITHLLISTVSCIFKRPHVHCFPTDDSTAWYECIRFLILCHVHCEYENITFLHHTDSVSLQMTLPHVLSTYILSDAIMYIAHMRICRKPRDHIYLFLYTCFSGVWSPYLMSWYSVCTYTPTYKWKHVPKWIGQIGWIGFDSQCQPCVEVSGKLRIPHCLDPPNSSGYLVLRSKAGSIVAGCCTPTARGR